MAWMLLCAFSLMMMVRSCGRAEPGLLGLGMAVYWTVLGCSGSLL